MGSAEQVPLLRGSNWDDIRLEFDPIDWQQLELLARPTPGERMRASVMAHEFATALLRGTLRRRFPDLSLAELNMMVLGHCTEVRGMEEGTFDER